MGTQVSLVDRLAAEVLELPAQPSAQHLEPVAMGSAAMRSASQGDPGNSGWIGLRLAVYDLRQLMHRFEVYASGYDEAVESHPR